MSRRVRVVLSETTPEEEDAAADLLVPALKDAFFSFRSGLGLNIIWAGR